jgi:hypothetical protein
MKRRGAQRTMVGRVALLVARIYGHQIFVVFHAIMQCALLMHVVDWSPRACVHASVLSAVLHTLRSLMMEVSIYKQPLIRLRIHHCLCCCCLHTTQGRARAHRWLQVAPLAPAVCEQEPTLAYDTQEQGQSSAEVAGSNEKGQLSLRENVYCCRLGVAAE